jgi:hypothetical protein
MPEKRSFSLASVDPESISILAPSPKMDAGSSPTIVRRNSSFPLPPLRGSPREWSCNARAFDYVGGCRGRVSLPPNLSPDGLKFDSPLKRGSCFFNRLARNLSISELIESSAKAELFIDSVTNLEDCHAARACTARCGICRRLRNLRYAAMRGDSRTGYEPLRKQLSACFSPMLPNGA